MRIERVRAALAPLALFFLLTPLLASQLLAEHAVPAALDAGRYSAFDTHDGITVAADPYDSKAKEDVFRIDYLKYSILPIRIIVTNSTGRAVSLADARIHLVPAVGDLVQAAEPDDVERRVSMKDRVGSDIPIGPLKIHHGGKTSDSKVEQDFSEHEYSALTVEPHTTRAGFLFYDTEGLGSAPMKGAKVVFRRVRDADGKELFAFEVPLDKYLAEKK